MSPTITAWPEAVRRSYAQLIDALTATGAVQQARECAELAVRQGLWRDPSQRPVQYVPALDPVPVYDASDFWFCSYLEENQPLIAAELDAVTDPARSGFLPVEEPLLGAGRWDQVTFYEAGVRFQDACERFPVTASIIDGIPEAATASAGVVTLSWLYPGTHIIPHCGGTNARLRVHLGIRVPGGARLRVGEETLVWEEGRSFVFDDSFEHEVWHEGDGPRVILLMDVTHPKLDDATRERMLDSRTSYEERVGGFMRERGLSRIEADGEDLRVALDSGTAAQVSRYLRERDVSGVELRDGALVFDTHPAAGA